MTDTRERFIGAASTLFAERGFYGTSIAAIADALPFTKPASAAPTRAASAAS